MTYVGRSRVMTAMSREENPTEKVRSPGGKTRVLEDSS